MLREGCRLVYIAAGRSTARHERWLTDQRAQPVVTKNRNAKCERGRGARKEGPMGPENKGKVVGVVVPKKLFSNI